MGPKNPHEQTARDWDSRTHEQTVLVIGTQEPMNGQPLSTCVPRTHEVLVMIDSGASVNVCPPLILEIHATCLRGANGKPLQEFGKRQIWPMICGQDETVRFPCGGRDEIDPECELSV